jgi:hypothetical protein
MKLIANLFIIIARRQIRRVNDRITPCDLR